MDLSKIYDAMVIAEKKYKVAELFAYYSNAESEMAKFVLEKADVEFDKAYGEIGKAGDEDKLNSAKIRFEAAEVKYVEADEKVEELISKAKLAHSQLREASTVLKSAKITYKIMEQFTHVPGWILMNQPRLIGSLKGDATMDISCLPEAIVRYIGEFINPILKCWERDNRHIKIVELLWDKFDNFDNSKMCRRCRLIGKNCSNDQYHDKLIHNGIKLIRHHLA
jgi:hypothetical protein